MAPASPLIIRHRSFSPIFISFIYTHLFQLLHFLLILFSVVLYFVEHRGIVRETFFLISVIRITQTDAK